MIIPEKIQVFFRFDDITALSCLHFERKLLDVFTQQKITCSIGVVPFVTTGAFEDPFLADRIPLSEKKIEFLKLAVRQGSFDLIMHGYSHQAITQCLQPSEFVGLSMDRQESLLRRGKDILEEAIGKQVTAFIPPWNTYDQNTLKILKQIGFKGISANFEGPVVGGMKYVPYTTGINGLKTALQYAKKSVFGGIIGVLLHPSDFVESEDRDALISFSDLVNIISWLKLQPNVSIVSISQLIEDQNTDIGEERFRTNKAGFWESVNPPLVGRIRNKQIYLPTKNARQNKFVRLGLMTSFYFIPFLFSCFITNKFSFVLENNNVPAFLPFFLVVIGICLLIGRGIRDRVIYFKPFFLIVLLAGIGFGLTI